MPITQEQLKQIQLGLSLHTLEDLNCVQDILVSEMKKKCVPAAGYDMNKHTSEKSYAEGKETNTAKFDAQIQTVTQERGATYGEAHVNFGRMGLCHEIVKDCQDEAIKAALLMVMYKVCRLVQTPSHLDSAVDIAGYARCIAMIQDNHYRE